MRIVIVSNITNGIGLERDFCLLRDWLFAHGHSVTGQQYDKPATGDGYDLGIFLETIADHLIPISARWWYFANPEWLKPEYVRPIQRHCEGIYAKTLDAATELRRRFSSVHYVGFLTADKRVASIPRTPRFLHIGGNGGYRNTNSILAAWREYRYWLGPSSNSIAPLTVVSNSHTVDAVSDVPDVTFIKRATDDEITHLQNSHLYHLYPSAYEGFGHAIHEAQSVGAIILTTAAPPMSELNAPFTVPATKSRQLNYGSLHDVSPADIRAILPHMLDQPSHEIARMRMESRSRFERGNAEFTTLFTPFIEKAEGETVNLLDNSSTVAVVATGPSPLVPSPSPLRIAMIGNFGPPHSTENDLLWTLRDLGHQVTAFQENEDSTECILSSTQNCQLLLYVHTHGWSTPGRLTLDQLFGALKDRGTITASFHLDRYWGLNELDQRESRIGQHPFWHTDYVFTADGGNQQNFRDRHVAHYWLPPGVCKRDANFGSPQRELSIDVGFVGAEGYHPEYPFRSQLIEFLRAVYGPRFRVFTGYRGQALNDLYSSIRVCVGDSCFAGADYYWSDRIPETLGRGGFLLHPATRGLSIPGLVTFEPGNLADLQDKIDYALAHDSFRKWSRSIAQQWVSDNETYSNRMATLLRTVGLA